MGDCCGGGHSGVTTSSGYLLVVLLERCHWLRVLKHRINGRVWLREKEQVRPSESDTVVQVATAGDG